MTNARFLAAFLTLSALAPLSALAQNNPADPAAAAPKPPATVDWPKPAATSTDPDVLAALQALTGSFRAPAKGDSPAIDLHTALVNVPGLDNALYFELTRSDSPQASFHSGLFTFINSTADGAKGLRLRIIKFSGLPSTFAQAVTGLYLAPEAFPSLAFENLTVTAEIPLTRKDNTFSGEASGVPIFSSGALYLSSAVRFDGTTVRWADRGLDPAGKTLWGPASDSDAPVFTRFVPTSKVERRDSRLIIIDLVSAPADAPVSTTGSSLALHYTGWLLADGFRFDSSLDAGRRPIETTVPLGLIEGWNQGIPGIQQGTIRRLIIPGALGYGDRGNPRAKIPANATLVFEVNCVYHRLAGEKPAAATPDAPVDPVTRTAPTTVSPSTPPANPAPKP